MAAHLLTYEAVFSVPLKCDACVEDIKQALNEIPGIAAITCSIAGKLVTVRSSVSPSRIVTAIQRTGRSAVLRGSGHANSAAACILEATPQTEPPLSPTKAIASSNTVRGLIRLIEIGDRYTMLDLTVTGMQPGLYSVSIREKGDISCGKQSLGPEYTGVKGDKNGRLGKVLVDATGKASEVKEINFTVWESIGRSILFELQDDDGTLPASEQLYLAKCSTGLKGITTAIGVIARSAGAWENDKAVCSCSGKTVWEEREEMIRKGMC